MPSKNRPCTARIHPPCPGYATPGTSRCPLHQHTRRAPRPSAHRRGYGRKHADRFREPVLRRDPTCTCTHPCPEHAAEARCWQPSTQADHYPRTKQQIIDDGDDPLDPAYGRGLCAGCHSRHTARTARRGGYRPPRMG